MLIHYQKNIFLTFFLILFWTGHSYACSCEGEGTVAGSVKSTDIVFSGQVVSSTLTTNYDSLGIIVSGDTNYSYFELLKFPTAVVKIKVDRMYKGQLVTDTLTILTPPNDASCGVDFQVGQRYIVYATIFDEMLMTDKVKRRTFDNKTFWTNRCTRTQNWNTTEENEIIKVIN